MISVDKALDILSDHILSPEPVSTPLNEALGATTSEAVFAGLTLPPQDASAMDGYAVKLDDVKQSGTRLSIIGEVPAGHDFDDELKAGEAVRIFTGSPIPKGAETVIIQENVDRSDDHIQINHPQDQVKHIRRAGIDFHQGNKIIPTGKVIGPAEIALAAASNLNAIKVFKRPKVAILAAGDELITPGDVYAPGKIVNSNTPSLSALIRHWGGEVVNIGLGKDDPDQIRDLFESARQGDIIVPVGGASVGDYDYMRRVFNDLGGKMIFEKIAVKPGKPTWFGRLGETPVLGLPGNPASALVCAHLFLTVLMGRPRKPSTQAFLTKSMPSNGPREHYLRAYGWIEKGQFLVKPFPRQDSSLLTPFLDANLLIRRAPLADSLAAGDLVEVLDLGTGPSFV